jgi:hypothetical protein
VRWGWNGVGKLIFDGWGGESFVVVEGVGGDNGGDVEEFDG